MIDDEEPSSGETPSVTPPGPRRSTYTPPAAGAAYDPAATDDEALAGALSEQFQRWAPPTGAEPERGASPTSPSPTTPSDAPAWSPFAPDPGVEPILPPTTATSQAAPQTVPQTTERALPAPPERRSLTDEELLAAADPSSADQSTAALLDLVEQQLALRAEEAQRLAAWEHEVRDAAGPEADPIVAQVRSQFTGVIPIVVAPAESAPVAPAEPEPVAPAKPEPVSFAEPEPLERPALDLALADAPPPFGSTATLLPPPPAAEEAPSVTSPTDDVPSSPWAPPPLIEPVAPEAHEPPTGPTAIDHLFAAADPVPAPPEEVGELDHEVESASSVEPPVASPDVAHGDEAPDLPQPGDESVEAVTKVPTVERTGLEPTPTEQRAGRSIRLFWLWFAVNSSVVSVALGAVVLGLGMSLRQALFSVVIGIAVSFLPLGLGTLASKWSGQPTMVVSRSTFGTGGNVIPALVALITRVVWSAALVWLLAIGVAEVLIGSGLLTVVPRFELSLIIAGAGLAVITVLAALGFRVIAITSAIVSAVSAVLVVGLIVLTMPFVDVSLALSVADGPAILLLTGAVLVFSVVGLAWANSSGDLARYQAKGTAGSAALLSTALGATIPAAVLICWGSVLAASNPAVAEGLVTNPVDILGRMLPLWYPAPLIAAIALSLIASATLALYSAGFATLALGVRVSRPIAVVIALPLVVAAVAGLAMLSVDAQSLFRDVATTLAVPIAAWAGIFGAETMIRSRRVHSPSLLRSGGVYPAVRWLNLVSLVVITAIGWGFTSASVTGLEWQGWAWALAGIDVSSALGGSDAGVFAALLLGLLVPILAGIPAMRALQTAERQAAALDEAALKPVVPGGAATTNVTVLPSSPTATPAGS